MDLIVIAGSPGAGKSTLGLALARSLGAPFLEFSVLRQPQLDPPWSNASPVEHEMAWESLQCVVRNYAAVAWNAAVRARPALPREAKIEVDGRSVEELLETIRRI